MKTEIKTEPKTYKLKFTAAELKALIDACEDSSEEDTERLRDSFGDYTEEELGVIAENQTLKEQLHDRLAKKLYGKNAELLGAKCPECGDYVSEFMLCPDGAEICQMCFDQGAH